MSEAPAPQSLPPSSSRHLKRGSTTSEHESGGGSSRGIKIPQLTGSGRNSSSNSGGGGGSGGSSFRMSWIPQRLMHPGTSRRGPLTLTSQEYAARDVEKNLVCSGLKQKRKLKTTRRRWFALYAASERHPAHLEYHESESKWKSGEPPSREIILKDCFNIAPERNDNGPSSAGGAGGASGSSSANSNSTPAARKHIIHVYTLDDCVSILFTDDQDMKNWLGELLNHQKGRSEDGRVPKPNYENMWSVEVKEFKAEDPMNPTTMSGPHRLVIKGDEISLFELGKLQPTVLKLNVLRSLVSPNKEMFRLPVGRLAPTGAGTIDLVCSDKEAALSIYNAAQEMRSNHSQLSNRPSAPRGSINPHGTGGTGVTSTSHLRDSQNTSTGPYRPRSESCSKIADKKPVVTGSSLPKPAILAPTSNETEPQFHPHPPVASRIRTTSEGNHHVYKTRINPGISGSPLSPSPGSYISSESAGSSNSIDDDQFVPDRRHGVSDQPPPATIIEESSAESWVDPNSSSTGSTIVTPAAPIHQRTKSDTVQYTSVDVLGKPLPPSAAAATLPVANSTVSTGPASLTGAHHPTQYSTLMNSPVSRPEANSTSPAGGAPSAPAQAGGGFSDYFVMSPPSEAVGGVPSATSSAAASTEAERRRLQRLGLEDGGVTSPSPVPAAITSPSSQCSQLEEGVDALYTDMSPVGSLENRRGIPISTSNNAASSAAMMPSSRAGRGRGGSVISASSAATDTDEYMTMSPQQGTAGSSSSTSSSAQKTTPKSSSYKKSQMDIPLQKQQPDAGAGAVGSGGEYMLMSPGVEVDKHRLAEATPGTPVHVRSDSSSSVGAGLPPFGGGARPKLHARTAAGSSKRSSFCSESDDGPVDTSAAWAGPSIEMDDPDNPEYATLDYSTSSRSAIPIPRGAGSHPVGGWMSPGSSGSLISGTPNSSEANDFAHHHRAGTYLRREVDEEENAVPKTTNPPLRSFPVTSPTGGPPSGGRTATVSTSSNSSSLQSGRSRTSSLTSRFIEIPSSSRSKHSPSQFGKTPPAPPNPTPSSTSGQSPGGGGLLNRFDSWFRSRAGSVPSRPNLGGRRRHRTQSEGEKDSPDNQEATELTEAAKKVSMEDEDEDVDEEIGCAVDER